MAILKGSFEEEILPKPQRVIVKAIFKMSQLNEAKLALTKIYQPEFGPGKSRSSEISEKVDKVNAYFDLNIETILNSIKLPKPKV